MKGKLIALVSVLMLLGGSCGKNKGNDAEKGSAILQQDDGTLALNLDKAACYSNTIDPSSNTAEWSFIVSKPGRYKLWLSSATTDTTNLKYTEPVKVSFMDKLIEIKPGCDKIVRNSSDVTFPFFRADSYLGSFYISEPGQYNIQVISEKVLSKETREQISKAQTDTRLMSVILTPMTR
jgi:hypothetical protein